MSKKNKHKMKRDESPNAEEPPVQVAEDSDAAVASETAVDAPDEVGALRAEVEQWKDKFLRAKAEQQNTVRRVQNEVEDSIRYANANLLRALLDVVDDLERMTDAADAEENVQAVRDGVRLVQQKMAKFLSDHAVELIDATGATFDPAKHEALMQQPSTDCEPGQVVQQIQKGYAVRDRVLRPAKVIVATAPETDAESTESPDEAPDASGD